jgi:hypothetical protein
LRAAGSEFATDSFFSKNDAEQARTVGYTPFPASRVAFQRFEQNPAEAEAPVQPDLITSASGEEVSEADRGWNRWQQENALENVVKNQQKAQQPAPYEGPKVQQANQTMAPGTYATPDSAVYSRPPAGPYVRGTGNPFSRRPDWPRTANPFDGQQSTGRPVAVNPNVVNPFGRPRVNPFADPPPVIGRTAPASDRMPGPVPSNEVYNSRSRGGNLSSIRNVLGDAAEVMNRPKPPQR